MKTCTHCKIDKPLSSKHWIRNNRTSVGWCSTCKECRNADKRASRTDEVRRYEKLKRYGLNYATYCEMLAAQDNQCAICSVTFTSEFYTHVDHDHDTDKVRALLCHHCNVGIGMLKESPAILSRAAAYLEKHQCA